MSEIDFVKQNYGQNYVKKLLAQPYHESTTRHLRDVAHIIQLVRGNRVLDMGCGSGITSCFLARCGYQVTGVDISKDMIKVAKIRAKKEGVKIDFKVGTFENYYKPNYYDTVVFYDALHHSPDKMLAIKQAYKNLKKGGVMLLFEPNLIHKWQNRIDKFGRIEEGLYKWGWSYIIKTVGFREIESYFVYDRIYPKTIQGIMELVLRFLYQLMPADISTRVIMRCVK